MNRAEFYGAYWYYMDLMMRSKVDGWDMERAWERYQVAPDGEVARNVQAICDQLKRGETP